MDLSSLNARWSETGKPHAVAVEGGLYRGYCPECQEWAHTRLPLVGAMSEALAHKNKCKAVV